MPTRPPLANAELAIMDLLWDEERLTAREIRERLYPESPKAQHGTVQRLLQRLEEKGYVRRDTRLAVHLFSAAVGREDYASSQLESLAERLTHGSLAPLVTHLIEQNRLSPAELQRLRQILDEEPGPPQDEA
jgi:BlaI family transcriptional regulator, penicillinase repressor